MREDGVPHAAVSIQGRQVLIGSSSQPETPGTQAAGVILTEERGGFLGAIWERLSGCPDFIRSILRMIFISG